MTGHGSGAHGDAHGHDPNLQHHFYSMEQQLEASTLGMWVFLVTEIRFFGGMFMVYIVYRIWYPDAWVAGSNHLDVALGALNTAVLICSSLTMALAVRAAQVGSRRGPAKTITHEALILPAREKSAYLAKYLRKTQGPAIVFVNTKIGCDRLARELGRQGIRAAAVHADRAQKDRTAAIEAFRSGRTRTLVATDVAARGLDIEAVSLIVNFEVPRGLDTYVHRVGRTGRNDMAGHALTLADPSERRDLEQIEQAFGLKLVTV